MSVNDPANIPVTSNPEMQSVSEQPQGPPASTPESQQEAREEAGRAPDPMEVELQAQRAVQRPERDWGAETLETLQAEAKSMGLSGYSNMKKDELADLVARSAPEGGQAPNPDQLQDILLRQARGEGISPQDQKVLDQAAQSQSGEPKKS